MQVIVVCRVGEHWLVHWCSLCSMFFGHTWNVKLKRNGIWGWVIHGLNGWGRFGKVSCFRAICFKNTGLQGSSYPFQSSHDHGFQSPWHLMLVNQAVCHKLTIAMQLHYQLPITGACSGNENKYLVNVNTCSISFQEGKCCTHIQCRLYLLPLVAWWCRFLCLVFFLNCFNVLSAFRNRR